MNLQSIFDAILLGIVEGVTEFIPVSSTGHLLLATLSCSASTARPKAFWDTFNVLIQLGAILAVVVVYFGRLWRVLLGAAERPGSAPLRALRPRRLPAGGDRRRCSPTISSRTVLFNSPTLICVVLIVGGVAAGAARPLRRATRCTTTRCAIPLGVALAHRPVPVPGDGAGRVALRRDHRRRAADALRQARGGGVLVLPRDPDHARRLRPRLLREPRRPLRRRRRAHR